jgi:carboxymethylenebutenolidase
MKKNINIGNFDGYHSTPEDAKQHPGLIVIHEIWGLDGHIRNVADRFSAQGYIVVAPNLFHGVTFEGKIDQVLMDELRKPETRDEAQKKMRAIIAPIMAPEFAQGALARLKQCVDYLLGDKQVNGQVGVLGFCFGGTYSFHLAAGDRRINVAVPFYGQTSSISKCNTRGIY